MKKDRIKKYTVRFGIIFFLVLALLTYFSSTIDNMLLPKVKVTMIESGTLDENDQNINGKYLVPISAVVNMGDQGVIYYINDSDEKKTTVSELSVSINSKDDLFFEVSGGSMYSGMYVVYETSKDISEGDRVYVEGDELS